MRPCLHNKTVASRVITILPLVKVLLWLQEYESAVEDRNHTGIMLIDRNDELCILYEKANTQEEVMR